MSVGGRIIEILDMTITAGEFPGQPTRVKRLWCLDCRNGYSDETCVYAEWYPEGQGPRMGDEIWWQGGKIFYDCDRRAVRKIGYSFSPESAGLNDGE